MKEYLSPEHPFFSFMGKIGDFILLNILFVLTSLPVITIGTSITALYLSINQVSKNEESYIIRTYFKLFFSNLKKTTILWCIYLCFALPLFYASSLLSIYGERMPLLFIPYIFILIIYVFSLIYIFPLNATFENTIVNLLRNSLLTALANLPITIVLMLLFYLPATFTLLFPEYFHLTFIIWLLIGFSSLCFIANYLYQIVMKKYL